MRNVYDWRAHLRAPGSGFFSKRNVVKQCKQHIGVTISRFCTVLFVTLFCTSLCSAQATGSVFYSKADGPLTFLSTWGSNPDGSGAEPTSFNTNATFNLSNRAEYSFIINTIPSHDTLSILTIPGTLNIPADHSLFLPRDFVLSVGKITGAGSLSFEQPFSSPDFYSPNGINLNLTGADSSSLSFTPGLNTLFSLTVHGKVNFANPLNIDGIFTVRQAATVYTNDNLTLKSPPANHQQGVLSRYWTNSPADAEPIGTILGNVTVERGIMAGKRGWRLLSVPVNTTQSIRQAWQENGNNTPGVGTLITSNAYNGSNGFDMTSVSSSILTHNQGGAAGPSWSPVVSTNTPLTNPGYMLFVRGDRSATPANSTASATVLRTTGTLRKGTQPAQTISATGSGYTLVGNPYASPLNLDRILDNTPNLNQAFYIWDSRLAGTYGVGGFRLIERINGSDYHSTPPIPSGVSRDYGVVAVGQAFLLKATGGNANIAFRESDMEWNRSHNAFRPTEVNQQQLLINLLVPDANNTMAIADGMRVRYNDTYSAAVTAEDVEKMNNFAENLASLREGKSLIVEKRPVMAARDTVFLSLTNTSAKQYAFTIEMENLPANLSAVLVDKFVNTETPLTLTGSTQVNFAVTSATASKAADRFMVVFKPGNVLPVSLVSFRAFQKEAQRIAVEWKVAQETNQKAYEVEKSTDGRTFAKVGEVAATGKASYAWTDENAAEGYNYYRLKPVEETGRFSYSSVARVLIGKAAAGYQVYPNPVANNTINLSFINQPSGKYTVRLLNAASQLVYQQQLTRSAGNSAEAIMVPGTVQKGAYLLQIISPAGNSQTIQVQF